MRICTCYGGPKLHPLAHNAPHESHLVPSPYGLRELLETQLDLDLVEKEDYGLAPSRPSFERFIWKICLPQ
jgi:hypothetical protein